MIALERPETLTAAVATAIKDAIVRGRFQPGQRLPEVALSAEMNTSRGTVREALRMLADSGLIEIRPRRGVFVSELTYSDAREITSLRALLEPYATRLAMERDRLDPAYLREVREAFGELCEAIDTHDPVIIASADVAFHRAVFSRCAHRMLLDQLTYLQVLARRVVITNQLLSDDAPTLVGQHRAIMEAVESGEPARAEAAVRAHVIEGGELLLERVRRTARQADLDVGEVFTGSWPD